MANDLESGHAPAVDDDWMAEVDRHRRPPEPTETAWPVATQHRRRDGGVVRHSIDRTDVEPVEGEKQYLATVVWTLAWFVIPVGLYAAWTLTFTATPGTACANPVDNACPSLRSAALDALGHNLPWFCVAIVFSLLMALLIRLGSGAWRPVTAAFSAAVIGAGAATILFSALAT
jgi:hypothetical protein